MPRIIVAGEAKVEILHSASQPAKRIHEQWTSFVNSRYVEGLAVDGEYLWAVGGGVTRFDFRRSTRTRFLTEHGLASNDCRAIAVGEKFVWVATAAGVSRYSKRDGTWRNYQRKDGLADDVVVSVAIDQKNRVVWFGTWDSGVTRYDIDKDNWRTYSTEDGLSDNCVISLALDLEREALLCGTWSGGVSRFDMMTNQWTRLEIGGGLSRTAVTSIAVGSDWIWFGTLSAGVSRYDVKGSTWEHFTTQNGLAGNQVSSIVLDKSGNRAWVGNRSGGVSWFEEASGKWLSSGEALGLGLDVSSVGLGSDGRLFLGTMGQGVVEYRHNSGGIKLLEVDGGIAHNRVVSILAENGGRHVWFGTEGGGASSYDQKTENWRELNAAAGLVPGNTANAIAIGGEKGSAGRVLWFATLEGVARVEDLYNDHGANSIPVRLDLRNELIESLALDSDGGILWAGTNNGGLYRYRVSAGEWRRVDALPDSTYFALAWDKREGVLWCGTRNGIMGFDVARNQLLEFEGLPVRSSEIRSVLVDHKRDVLWAGSWLSGLFSFDKKERRWTRYTMRDRLPGDSVVGLALDRRAGHEALWAGTDRGVAKYDFATGRWLNFGTHDGLAHSFVLAVAVDDKGSLWFGTWGGGVSRYVGE